MNEGALDDWVAGLLSPEVEVESPSAPRPGPSSAAAPQREAVMNAMPKNDTAAATAGPETPTRYVTFRVDCETYALDVLRVREVLRSAEVVPVPGAPESVLGVINLRGSIVPVVDARRRLGLAPLPADVAGRVLIMESGWQAVGLRVDSVAEVTSVDADECEPPPPVGQGEPSRCLRGVVRRNDEFMILVDVDDLLPAAANQALAPLP